jgi:hypothetical protein
MLPVGTFTDGGWFCCDALAAGGNRQPEDARSIRAISQHNAPFPSPCFSIQAAEALNLRLCLIADLLRVSRPWTVRTLCRLREIRPSRRFLRQPQHACGGEERSYQTVAITLSAGDHTMITWAAPTSNPG